MKTVKYCLQYLAIVSLVLMMVSGIYDISVGLRASAWYLKWYQEHYGTMAVLDVIFNFGLGLLRGTAVTFGCGLMGLVQIRENKVRTGYLLFLGFWAAQYVLSVADNAYKGIQTCDVMQMLAALFCFTALALYKTACRVKS